MMEIFLKIKNGKIDDITYTTDGCMTSHAAGKNKAREIVTYCDTGQCCPIWSYLFREVLGYTNVRIYSAGMQEWMQDTQAPSTR